MKAFIIALALLGCAASVQAQTSPCDVPQVLSFTLTKNDIPKFQACQPLQDPVTPSQTLRIDGAVVKVNGVDRPDYAPAVLMTPTPNAVGLVQWQVTAPGPFAKGNYTVTFRFFNVNSVTGARQEGPEAGPFDLSVVDPPSSPPSKPTNVVIRK